MRPTRSSAGGLLTMLFDTTFSEFVTLKLARWVYTALLVLGGLAGLVLGLSGFTRSVIAGLASLTIAVVLYLVGVILVRMWLEWAVVFFRLADHTAEIAEQAAQITVNTRSAPGQAVRTI